MGKEIEQFINYMREQFLAVNEHIIRLEGKLDAMTSNFITRAELEHHKESLDKAHDKIRTLFEKREEDIRETDKRFTALEVADAGQAGHMTWFTKIASAVLGILGLAAAAYFGLK